MSDTVFEAQCLAFFKAVRQHLADHDIGGEVEIKIIARGSPCHGAFEVEFSIGPRWGDCVRGRIAEAQQCVNEFLRRKGFDKTHGMTLLEYSGDVINGGEGDT